MKWLLFCSDNFSSSSSSACVCHSPSLSPNIQSAPYLHNSRNDHSSRIFRATPNAATLATVLLHPVPLLEDSRTSSVVPLAPEESRAETEIELLAALRMRNLRICQLFGRELLSDLAELAREPFGQCVHVSSLVDLELVEPGLAGSYRTIRVGESFSPTSEIDWLILNWVRSSAKCVVSTGAILRQEPKMRTVVQTAEEELAYWRKVIVGIDLPCADNVLLTRDWRTVDDKHPYFVRNPGSQFWLTHFRSEGGEFPKDHPLYQPISFERQFSSELEFMEAVLASVRNLRASTPGFISIEAGPSTTFPIYNTFNYPPVFQVLVLSIYRPRIILTEKAAVSCSNSSIDYRAIGKESIPKSVLKTHYKQLAEIRVSDENDWTFKIYKRNLIHPPVLSLGLAT